MRLVTKKQRFSARCCWCTCLSQRLCCHVSHSGSNVVVWDFGTINKQLVGWQTKEHLHWAKHSKTTQHWPNFTSDVSISSQNGKHQKFTGHNTGNRIEDEGMCHLSKALETNTTLTLFSVGGKQCRQHGNMADPCHKGAHQTQEIHGVMKEHAHWATHSKWTRHFWRCASTTW